MGKTKLEPQLHQQNMKNTLKQIDYSIIYCGLIILIFQVSCNQTTPNISSKQPIIDMHLHSFPINWFGNPDSVEWMHLNLKVPKTDDDLMQMSIEELKRFNVVKAIASGPIEFVDKWISADKDRIMAGVMTPELNQFEELRKRHAEGKLDVLGELAFQWGGIAPNDSTLEPYYSLAEELDIPIGIHVGLGAPGINHTCCPNYRMEHSRATYLEEILTRHPNLRLYAMHAGWPMLDEMVGLMYNYPNLYVDISVINWYIPTEEFHFYLKRLVNAGFGKRIMYGSDQMIWPESIKLSIESITNADFLTPEQKSDILFNNAARFLRLSEEEIAKYYSEK